MLWESAAKLAASWGAAVSKTFPSRGTRLATPLSLICWFAGAPAQSLSTEFQNPGLE